MSKLYILAIIIVITAGVLFLRFGRSIYMPVIKKHAGKETVESVRERLSEKILTALRPQLQAVGLSDFPRELVFVGLKEERRLEVYVKNNNQVSFFKSYPFTAFSGKIGPKLKEGDRQIPEGIYKIEYLNPNSSYYLSMKVDYPNDFDKAKAVAENRTNLGGDIFIHGKAATIGCIPVGDEAIEELFLLAANARPKDFKVIISPKDFRRDSVFPKIEAVDWSEELYRNIKRELLRLPGGNS